MSATAQGLCGFSRRRASPCTRWRPTGHQTRRLEGASTALLSGEDGGAVHVVAAVVLRRRISFCQGPIVSHADDEPRGTQWGDVVRDVVRDGAAASAAGLIGAFVAGVPGAVVGGSAGRC